MTTTSKSNGRKKATEPAGPHHTGRWTKEEHDIFIAGLRQHGKEWKTIAAMVETRTVVQIRTHAQKYFQKLAKMGVTDFTAEDAANSMATRPRATSVTSTSRSTGSGGSSSNSSNGNGNGNGGANTGRAKSRSHKKRVRPTNGHGGGSGHAHSRRRLPSQSPPVSPSSIASLSSADSVAMQSVRSPVGLPSSRRHNHYLGASLSKRGRHSPTLFGLPGMHLDVAATEYPLDLDMGFGAGATAADATMAIGPTSASAPSSSSSQGAAGVGLALLPSASPSSSLGASVVSQLDAAPPAAKALRRWSGGINVGNSSGNVNTTTGTADPLSFGLGAAPMSASTPAALSAAGTVARLSLPAISISVPPSGSGGGAQLGHHQHNHHQHHHHHHHHRDGSGGGAEYGGQAFDPDDEDMLLPDASPIAVGAPLFTFAHAVAPPPPPPGPAVVAGGGAHGAQRPPSPPVTPLADLLDNGALDGWLSDDGYTSAESTGPALVSASPIALGLGVAHAPVARAPPAPAGFTPTNHSLGQSSQAPASPQGLGLATPAAPSSSDNSTAAAASASGLRRKRKKSRKAAAAAAAVVTTPALASQAQAQAQAQGQAPSGAMMQQQGVVTSPLQHQMTPQQPARQLPRLQLQHPQHQQHHQAQPSFNLAGAHAVAAAVPGAGLPSTSAAAPTPAPARGGAAAVGSTPPSKASVAAAGAATAPGMPKVVAPQEGYGNPMAGMTLLNTPVRTGAKTRQSARSASTTAAAAAGATAVTSSKAARRSATKAHLLSPIVPSSAGNDDGMPGLSWASATAATAAPPARAPASFDPDRFVSGLLQ